MSEPSEPWEADAVGLYRTGVQPADIARALGVEEERVADSLTRFMTARAQALTSSTEMALEVDRVDELLRVVWLQALKGEVRYIELALRILDRRKKLVACIRPVMIQEGRRPGVRALARKSDPSIWHRQPGETNKAYTAFQCYRDLGPGRTQVAAWAVYREMNNLRSAKPSHPFRRWIEEHKWDTRCLAFDNDVTDATVGNSVEIIEATRRAYMDAAPQAAMDMVRMAQGEAPNHARIAAIRDILDRVGFVRQRRGFLSESPAPVEVNAENAQLNFNLDFSDMSVNDKAAFLQALTEE